MSDSPRRPQRRSAKIGNSSFRRLPLGSLRVFVAVAEHLSFTRAAESLGVSVSAASMQVQALEQRLGLPLFRRDGRSVEMTAEGVLMLPRVSPGHMAARNISFNARRISVASTNSGLA